MYTVLAPLQAVLPAPLCHHGEQRQQLVGDEVVTGVERNYPFIHDNSDGVKNSVISVTHWWALRTVLFAFLSESAGKVVLVAPPQTHL